MRTLFSTTCSSRCLRRSLVERTGDFITTSLFVSYKWGVTICASKPLTLTSNTLKSNLSFSMSNQSFKTQSNAIFIPSCLQRRSSLRITVTLTSIQTKCANQVLRTTIVDSTLYMTLRQTRKLQNNFTN